jgi:hypothetical protein
VIQYVDAEMESTASAECIDFLTFPELADLLVMFTVSAAVIWQSIERLRLNEH